VKVILLIDDQPPLGGARQADDTLVGIVAAMGIVGP